MDEEECFYKLYLGYQRFGVKYPEILGVGHELEELVPIYDAVKSARANIGQELLGKLGRLGIDTYGFDIDGMDFRLGKSWCLCVNQNGCKFVKVKISEISTVYNYYIDEDIKPIVKESVTILTTIRRARIALSTSMRTEDEHVE